VNDGFARIIELIAAEPSVLTVLEIGSSTGGGSTSALVRGLTGKTDQRLFCLELSVPRFNKLRSRYAHLPWVHCLNMTSVAVSDFPGPESISEFYRRYPDSPLQNIPRKEVERWLHQDIEYVTRFPTMQNGISAAKELAEVPVFDLVLIDGSEFTGTPELEQLSGARYVLLDDTLTFKNHENRVRLTADPNYRLIIEDKGCRNGYAAFRRADAPPPW